MALLNELGLYLEEQGVGTLAVDMTLGQFPDTPDDAVVLLELKGWPPGLTDSVEPRRVQVRTRAVHYEDARDKAETVYGLLHGVAETVLFGARFLLITALAPPYALGRDRIQRHMFALDFRVLYDNAAGRTSIPPAF